MDVVRPPRLQELPLKADTHLQLILLDLQAQDSTLAQLSHRRTTLPELAAIAELESRRRDLDGRRIEIQTRVDDLGREQRKADAEVEQVRSRRERDEQRLASGAISNPKDLESLQHELVALQRRIGTLEDAELEIMEALEGSERDLAEVLAAIAEIDAELVELAARRDAAGGQIDAAAQEAQAERATLAASVGADLLALYEKLRGQYGTGAAALRARRCEGCRLELNGSDLRDIAARPDDDVLRCPECGRILVRTNESGI